VKLNESCVQRKRKHAIIAQSVHKNTSLSTELGFNILTYWQVESKLDRVWFALPNRFESIQIDYYKLTCWIHRLRWTYTQTAGHTHICQSPALSRPSTAQSCWSDRPTSPSLVRSDQCLLYTGQNVSKQNS